MDESQLRDANSPTRDAYWRPDPARPEAALTIADPAAPQPVSVPEPVTPSFAVPAAPVAPVAPMAPAAPIAPQPLPQPPMPAAAPVPLQQPIVISPTTEAPAQPSPQYSELTPIYAQTPVKTLADIPQPAVKSMEFVSPQVPVLPPAYSGPTPEPTYIEPTPQPAPAVTSTWQQPAQPVLDPTFVSPLEQSFATTAEEPAQQQTSYATSPSYVGLASTMSAPVIGSQSGGGNFFERFKKPLIIAAIAVVLLAGGIVAAIALTSGNSDTSQSEGINEPTEDTPVVTNPDPDTDEETPVVTNPDPETNPDTEPDTDIEETPTPEPTPTPTPEPTTPTPTQPTPDVPNTGFSEATAASPKKIDIPAIGVSAGFENVGLTRSGAIGAPNDVWKAGWYTSSAQPGKAGAVFVDGHASSNQSGVFGYLKNLRVGDEVKIQRNDNKEITYLVVKVAVADRRDVDVASMLRPYAGAKRGLNIMSCTGSWVESEKTLSHRVLVYTVEK